MAGRCGDPDISLRCMMSGFVDTNCQTEALLLEPSLMLRRCSVLHQLTGWKQDIAMEQPTNQHAMKAGYVQLAGETARAEKQEAHQARLDEALSVGRKFE